MDIEHCISPEELAKQRDIIVERLLPQFHEMCKNYSKDTAIVLTSAAFSDTPRETELMGLAIRYACDRGFEVRIVPFLVLDEQK